MRMQSSWKYPGLWRHVDNTTVAMEVTNCTWVPEKDSWSMRVSWYNIGHCHLPWPLGISQRIWIRREHAGNWQRMGEQDFGPAPIHRSL